MLTAAAKLPTDTFERLRAREFARLDEQGVAYLDYTGAALYGASQAAAYAERLRSGVFGNPHSAHGPSQQSERSLEAARAATLAYFDADPDLYEVCFTANASAAIKLVAESYPFGPERGLVLSADNHNSVNGIREFAKTAGAPIVTLPLRRDLTLEDPQPRLASAAQARGAGLFAFPAQSNFSGVRHDPGLVQAAQALGFTVLVDAAGLGVCGGFSLTDHPADFLALSFYKIFGLPTGLGALIARREALAQLRRPWFAGGTVEFVSIDLDRRLMRPGHASFEDGTPSFLDVGAVEQGFDFLADIELLALKHRLGGFLADFLTELSGLTHRNGAPVAKVYGPQGMDARGGIVAFNIFGPGGLPVPYQVVEHQAARAGLALRGGCFCNPGAAEAAFGFRDLPIAPCLDRLGADFSIPALQHHLGPATAIGALRLSIGLPTNQSDLDRALAFVANFAEG